jgi:hypothetical protein
VLLALGVEQVLEFVGDTSHHELADPLPSLSRAALFGGVALYLVAQVAFKYRTWHQITGRRIAVVALLVALIPVTAEVPALGSLAILAAILSALIAWEAVVNADLRELVRHGQDVVGAYDSRSHRDA